MTADTPLTQLRIDAIRRDPRCQMRVEGLDDNHVLTLMQIYRTKRTPKGDPPVVFRDQAAVYWLADGFHRSAALVQLRRKTIDVDLRAGELRDAILFALSANSEHGLRRTNEDKRRCVDVMLDDPEWRTWPNTQIAQQCGVSEGLIRIIRGEKSSQSRSSVAGNGSGTGRKSEDQNEIAAIAKASKRLQAAMRLLRGVALTERVTEALEAIRLAMEWLGPDDDGGGGQRAAAA